MWALEGVSGRTSENLGDGTHGSVLALLLLALAALALSAPSELSLAACRRKATLFGYGVIYWVISRDATFQLPPDPGRCSAQVSRVRRIVFVRHGESSWNECFNRGIGLSFPLRLLRTVMLEATLALRLDSLLWDSPLSYEGVSQAKQLSAFIESSEGEEIRRLCENAVFVTSSLRRAASTALLVFGSALSSGRPVWVLSCLQEISRNVDTLALAAAQHAPAIGGLAARVPCAAGASPGVACSGTSPGCLQAAYNSGNKSLTSNGRQRLQAFCEWVFSDCGPSTLQQTVVVTGHSLWFKTFFQAYLPHTHWHECKHAKLVNCGVVAFDLEELREADEEVAAYRVVPDSVTSLYGGFEAKKKGKGKAPRAREERKKD